MRNICIAVALAVVAPGSAGHAAQGPRDIVSLRVEALKNTVEGTELRTCLARGDVEPGMMHDAWIVFGAVKARADKGWEPVASRTECGSGTFDKVGAATFRPFGTPYLIVDLDATPAVVEGRAGLAASLAIRKLSGFDANGRPTYTTAAQKRTLDLAAGGEMVVPVLFAEPSERESFGINEILFRLTAKVAGPKPPAAYGSLSVSTDIPGLDVYLDGGLVGRTGEGPLALQNVLVGTRQVLVKDFSGREARATIAVKKDQKTDVALKVLKLPTRENRDLSSIGKNPEGSDEFWRARDGALMLRVPAGEFLMGSAEGKGEAYERPQHRVLLSEFLVDKTEVTWRQYRRFVKATGATLPPEPIWGASDDYPVVDVRWDEAKAFCEWTGGRLPTEAEWEKTARGTDGREFPWGAEWDIDRCNAEDGGPHRPTAVGSYPGCLSPYGALDMVGSAREWCGDWYVAGYAVEASQRDPQGPATGSGRAIRGGSWMNNYSYQRTAARFGYDPAGRNEHIGFRCAQDAPK